MMAGMTPLPGRPQAVLLDAGGVLLLPSSAVIARSLADLGLRIDAERVARAHYGGVAALDASEASAIIGGPSDAFVSAFVAELVPQASQRAAASEVLGALFAGPAIRLWTDVVPGTTDGLRRLAASGIPLAVVSNSDGSVGELLRRAGVCQVGAGDGVPVRAVVDSSLVGMEKPDPAIFRIGLRAVGVEDPAAVIHVGDSVRADVAGARAAGVVPLHFDPLATCAHRDHQHVTGLGAVADLVTR